MSYVLEEIKCPFCEKGIIKVRYVPALKITKRSRGSATSGSYSYFSNEKYTVISEKCPSCSRTRIELEKFLNRGEQGKELPNEEVLRRLKEAGLDPTKLK